MDRANNRNGDGGLFTVLNKGVSDLFFPWLGNALGSRSVKIHEVDAGLGGNVELAIGEEMMEIIRTRFKKTAPTA